jgi:hypothetical protein
MLFARAKITHVLWCINDNKLKFEIYKHLQKKLYKQYSNLLQQKTLHNSYSNIQVRQGSDLQISITAK